MSIASRADFTATSPSPLPRRGRLVTALACGLLAVSPAQAIIGILTEFGTSGDGTEFVTTISTTDLVNSGAPSLSSVSSSPVLNVAYVNDGTGLSAAALEDSSQYPATIDFNLDLDASPLGYRITSLSTFTGGSVTIDPEWSGREHEFAHQSYSVFYSLVGDTGFTEFYTAAAVADPGEYAAKVTLVNIQTVVPDGVDAIRFTWLDPVPSIAPAGTDPQNTATIIREIDVFGSAVQVPEPSSALLLIPACLTFLRRRRPEQGG
ncbi:hypothetical protein [Haloferula sp. A504]|uniref:hypothetical protein n=1 Tax=Haloferula sp. A504 TaxID=3373601 RepID=UPI0031C72750|nr:hypothetical protein [Verrucomicrobiaceae bacterium E54]